MRKRRTTILIPVSPAELIDKICILEVKTEKISDPVKLRNIKYELQKMRSILNKSVKKSSALAILTKKLKATSIHGWKVEDIKRSCEAKKDFGTKFVNAARAAFKNNDERAKIWKDINRLLNAEIVNVKSYKGY